MPVFAAWTRAEEIDGHFDDRKDRQGGALYRRGAGAVTRTWSNTSRSNSMNPFLSRRASNPSAVLAHYDTQLAFVHIRARWAVQRHHSVTVGVLSRRCRRYLERRRSSVYVACMRILVLRRLLIFLTGLGFLVGAGAQAMPSARLMASALAGAGQTVMGVDCARMAMNGDATLAPMKQVPCKGISLDCATQLGCICSPSLPAPPAALGSPIAYGRLAYWPLPAAAHAGLSIEPNLFPPIAV